MERNNNFLNKLWVILGQNLKMTAGLVDDPFWQFFDKCWYEASAYCGLESISKFDLNIDIGAFPIHNAPMIV
ncbi:hypothetical protein COL154_003126 [Colletotrichum chrysophilum]|nr:hypothetical protein COL154_003126 [Colletotrichum chrysophilum]